jgi:hypothetical protein
MIIGVPPMLNVDAPPPPEELYAGELPAPEDAQPVPPPPYPPEADPVVPEHPTFNVMTCPGVTGIVAVTTAPLPPKAPPPSAPLTVAVMLKQQGGTVQV